MRQSRISESGLLPGKKAFRDGEGVRLSRKITMLHAETLNNRSFKIHEQKLIKLQKKNRQILN